MLFIQDAVDSDGDDDESVPFHEMGLDDRILKAIAKMGWSVPTLIQVRLTQDFLLGEHESSIAVSVTTNVKVLYMPTYV